MVFPATSRRGLARKPAESGAATLVRALFDDKASSRVTLRAGGLVSLGAGALGERSGALGERRVCAVCGARRAAWCVRGVKRTVRCVGSADWQRVRSGSGRRRERRERERRVGARRRGWCGVGGCSEPLIGARADQGLTKRCSMALSMPAGIRWHVSMAVL